MKGPNCYKDDCEFYEPHHGFCTSTDDYVDSQTTAFPVPICKFKPHAITAAEWAAQDKKRKAKPSVNDWVKSLRDSMVCSETPISKSCANCDNYIYGICAADFCNNNFSAWVPKKRTP
jgi:hypothetical protein